MARESKPSERRSRRAELIATYAAAAGFAYWLGVQGLLPYGPLKSSTSTPLARVGLALRDGVAHADAASLALLRRDVDAVRSKLVTPEHEAFDIVTALHGLMSGGRPDYPTAGRACLTLKFARCDQRALEVIEKRSRP